MGDSQEQISYDYFHPINDVSIFVKNIKKSDLFDFTSMKLNKDIYFIIECFNLLRDASIYYLNMKKF